MAAYGTALALTSHVSAATGANATAPIAAAVAVACSESRARERRRFQPACTKAAQSARSSGPVGTGGQSDALYGGVLASLAPLLPWGYHPAHGEQHAVNASHRGPEGLPADVRERPSRQALAGSPDRARPVVRARRDRVPRARGHRRTRFLGDRRVGDRRLRLLDPLRVLDPPDHLPLRARGRVR